MVRVNERKAVWSVADDRAAKAQGWSIFRTAETSRPFELQRLDRAAMFESDDSAQAFVRRALRHGDELARRAVDFLKVHSPRAHDDVVNTTVPA